VRIHLAALITGAAFIAGCHSEPTAPDDRSAAMNAAQTLLHLADSLSINGGSAGEIGAYRGLAFLLTGTGRMSTVTISVDGTPSEFLATAQEIQFGGCPPTTLCESFAPTPAPDHAVIAWQKSDPRRMVQFFMHGFDVVALSAGDTATVVSVPSLLYFDGSGSLYSGSTTSRSLAVTPSDTPCTTTGTSTTIEPGAVYSSPLPCTQAEFTVAFDGTAQPLPPVAYFASDSTVVPGNDAAPSHHIAMASQQVHGSHLQFALSCAGCVDSTQPPGSTPPVTVPWRDSLPATLTTTVGSDVTFTFTVTNASDSTKTLRFNDSQQFDIRVWDANNTLAWRWSAGQAFAQIVTSRTLAPHESVKYVEHWTPPSAGSYHAMAYLTSSSHGAVAFANFTKP